MSRRQGLRTAAKAAVAVGLLLVLGSCAAAPDDAGPRPADRGGAPPITVPRDLTSRAADPCGSLLSPAQVERLGYDPPGRFRLSVAGTPTCIWHERGSGRGVDVAVVLNSDLLVDTYRNRFLPVLRPLEIAGLPAVDIMSSPTAPVCTTTVGVADSQSLELNTSVGGGRPDGDPCAEGHRVAEEIISTLPPR